MATVTFRMDANKDLITTSTTRIYQHESKVDSVAFLLPTNYNELDLGEFKVVLKYTDFANNMHSVELEKDDEIYQDMYYRYIFEITSEMTQIAGELEFMIEVSKGEDTVLHTGTAKLTILPWKDYKVLEND